MSQPYLIDKCPNWKTTTKRYDVVTSRGPYVTNENLSLPPCEL